MSDSNGSSSADALDHLVYASAILDEIGEDDLANYVGRVYQDVAIELDERGYFEDVTAEDLAELGIEGDGSP